MKKEQYTFDQVLSQNFTFENVLIIGSPAAGKTHLCNLIYAPEHQKIHTDDYLHFGYQDALYKVLDDIIQCNRSTIVEGVQGYRLLRKGVELDIYYPDIVIELIVSDEHIQRVYDKERGGGNLKNIQRFMKSNQTILNDYLSMFNDRKPKWWAVENKF